MHKQQLNHAYHSKAKYLCISKLVIVSYNPSNLERHFSILTKNVSLYRMLYYFILYLLSIIIMIYFSYIM